MNSSKNRSRCHRRQHVLPSLILALTFCVAPTFASDGVIEINQAVADSGNMLAGDSAGFPVSITESGSYRLTSNLVIPGSPNPIFINMIEITASNVTLDLNGFVVKSTNVCSGVPISCTSAPGSGVNIRVSSAATNAWIHSGSVVGAPDAGIYCDARCRIEDMTVTHSGSHGIWLLDGGHASRSIVSHNARDGISGSDSRVVDCESRSNGERGFTLAGSSFLVNSTADSNEGDGAYVESGVIVGNLLVDNGAYGLSLSLQSGWGGNVITGNTTGSVTGSTIQLSTNVCATGTC